jgi:hypothetical protein
MDIACRYFVIIKTRIVSNVGALRRKGRFEVLGILAYHVSSHLPHSFSACKSGHVILHCLQLKYLITPVCF